MATRKTKTQRKRSAASPAKADPIGRPILFPEVSVCGHDIHEEDLRITARDAKVLLGWESESERAARLTEGVSPEVASRMNIKFGEDYDLIDYNGEKVRCWNNTLNRPLNVGWVEHLAQDILNNKWRFNGETWISSTTGLAVNMQHRATALIWAQQMVDYAGADKKKKDVAVHWQKRHTEPLFIEALIVRGVKETPDVIRTLDHVRPRSLSDVRVAVNKIPKADREGNDMDGGTVHDAASKLNAAASYLTWHENNTPAPYDNKFLMSLTYPSHGEYAEFPYPFYDTGIEVKAMVLNPNPWDEDDKPDEPFEVCGTLLIRPSPFGGFQCYVADHAVDPPSVEPVSGKKTTAGAKKTSRSRATRRGNTTNRTK